MTTLYFTHPSFFCHDTGPDHPECADRLYVIAEALNHPEFAGLERRLAEKGSLDAIRLVHTEAHIERVFAAIPASGHAYLDDDTVVSPGSGEAALYAVGAVCGAIDAVYAQSRVNAFCAVRPPGHHAEPGRAMGFCLFNNVAIGAAYARRYHGIGKIAIVDFDVHHGNGTQACFSKTPDVFYASTHQAPWYPGTGRADETGVGNILNVPLPAGSGSQAFRHAMVDKILPAIDRFAPELILISAGFDAHRDDPLSDLDFETEDFAWVTHELVKQAEKHANGRLVSVLEGGYDLTALGESVAAHVRALMSSGGNIE